MRLFPLPALLALALPACEAANAVDVPSGDFIAYTPDGADTAEPAPQDVLHLDIEAGTFGVTYEDGTAELSGTLTLLPEAQWLDDCYTMQSHTTTRAYTLDVDSVTILGATLPAPELSAKCGGRPLLWSSESEGAPDSGLVLTFDPIPE